MRCFSNDGQAGIIIFTVEVITNEVLCVYKSIIMIFHFNDEKYESGFYYVNAMIVENCTLLIYQNQIIFTIIARAIFLLDNHQKISRKRLATFSKNLKIFRQINCDL